MITMHVANGSDHGHTDCAGQRITAESCNGVQMELARKLIAVGADRNQPWQSIHNGGCVGLRGPSLGGLAALAVDANTRQVKWAPHPFAKPGQFAPV